MNRNKDGFPIWNDELESELFTREEILENKRAAKAICGQLAPLGKTIEIVPAAKEL